MTLYSSSFHVHEAMTDLNPGFTFDLGPDSGEAQAPWEFEGDFSGLGPCNSSIALGQGYF